MSLPARFGSVERLDAVDAFGLPEVYRGHDERLRRDVLLWPLRWGAGPADEDRRSLCLHTATTASQLDDPRLVQVYDCLPAAEDGVSDREDGDAVDWLVLESVEGQAVHDRLPWRTRLLIAQDVAEVLAELHARGAVHGGLDTAKLRLVGDAENLKILAPGPSCSGDEAMPSRSGDMLAFGQLLRELFGPQAGRLEPLVVALDSEAPTDRPTAAEALRLLSLERLRPRRLRRLAALWTLAALLAVWAVSFTLDLRSSLGDTVAAREDAVRAKSEAEELSEFLVGLFRPDSGDSHGHGPSGVEVTARDLLERGSRRIDRDFADRSRVRSRLLLTLGEVYEGLGSYDRAQALLEESLRVRRNDAGTPRAALAESLAALGHVLRYKGNEAEYSEAFEYLEEALALWIDEFGEVHADVAGTLNTMAILARRQGRYDVAETLYLRSLSIREQVFGPRHQMVSGSLNNLGLLYYYNGRLEEAETMLRRSLDIKEEVLAPNHPYIALGYNNLGNVMADRGDFEEAERFYSRGLEIREEVSGEMHPDTAAAVNNLGLLYLEWNRLDEAERFTHRALAIREHAYGLDHAATARNRSNLGRIFLTQGRLEEAQKALQEALAVQRRLLDPKHPDIGLSLDRMALLYLARSQPQRALEWVQQSYALHFEAYGAAHPDTADSQLILGRCALQMGETERALELIQGSVETYSQLGIQGFNLKEALEALAEAQEAAGRLGDAAATRARMVEMEQVP